jgi:hypothetical protein
MRAILGCVILALCWMAASVRADIFYTFDPLSSAGQNLTINATAGSTVAVPVYLSFTGGDASLLTGEKGLFSADVHLLRFGTLPSQPAMIANALAVQGNTQFDEPLGALIAFNSPGDVDLLQTVKVSDTAGVTGDPFGSGSRKINLGVFTFTAGNLAGQMTQFEAIDTPGFSDTVTFASSTVLDSRIGGAFLTINTVPATAVPLPGAVWGGLGLCGLLAAARSHRACPPRLKLKES